MPEPDPLEERPERMGRWPAPCLMLITDRHRLRGRPLEDVVSLAVEGGANVVQLREKDLANAELHSLAIALRDALRGRALLLINGHADVALSAVADGVHMPERSLPCRAVREMTNDRSIIGRSVHSVAAATQAEQDGVDYLQLGTIFKTASKPGVPPTGVGLIVDVADAVQVPVIAVGGVTTENVPLAIEAGAGGVAVIGAIFDADDTKAAAADIRRALDEAYSA